MDACRPVQEELDAQLEALHGEVPAGLRGRLFRNGAGKLEVEGTQQMHLFDGDGMISRFELGPEGVGYKNRYVRTREFMDERARGQMRYRAFGTNVPGGLPRNLLRMRFKNAANTSVMMQEGRLFALWEAGLPHEICPETLATIGRHDFGGMLRTPFPKSVINPELPFSAHPTRCPRTGDLYNFGLLIAPDPVLHLYRIRGGQLQDVLTHRLSRASFMHDFVLTERYAVFFASPITFDVTRTLAGLTTPVEAIRRDPGVTTEILVVPRDGGAPRRFEAPTGFFLFHFFGAFERGDEIVVHGCRMPDFRGRTMDLRSESEIRDYPLDPGPLSRWVLDLRGGGVEETVFDTPGLELPVIDPRFVTRPHTVGWSTALSSSGVPVFTGLARADLEAGTARVRDFGADLPGEPIFVPRSPDAAEGEGWLLSVVFRAETRRSELWILDPDTLEETARFGLPHHQPPGFHGTFVPA